MNPAYTAKGNLQISVNIASEKLPISGAQVKVTDPMDGSILEVLSTDSSGQTPTIELPAPPVAYSLGKESKKPYAIYNVTIRAGNFETLHIGSAQILPNSTAILDAALQPATASGFNVRNLLIAPHVLWGDYPAKIPEDEEKSLPDADNLLVLPEPVTPAYIVVHLGTPEDAAARNIRVSFKDYIKNVACCKIYPTWETETIKAHVLAIISFTLNRVYTEWYQEKGYDFTITNSTVYDQAFDEGRNIFEEISILVDELFATYITKETMGQPLCAQYCSDPGEHGAGLSPWNSLELGVQGMDAANILKQYYGPDILLKTTEKVEGVPYPFGGDALQEGSAGDAVRIIQAQINHIASRYPAIPKVKEDAVFGADTRTTVQIVQKILYLPQTGVVDFATWYRIFDALSV